MALRVEVPLSGFDLLGVYCRIFEVVGGGVQGSLEGCGWDQ